MAKEFRIDLYAVTSQSNTQQFTGNASKRILLSQQPLERTYVQYITEALHGDGCRELIVLLEPWRMAVFRIRMTSGSTVWIPVGGLIYLFIYTWNQHIKPYKTVYTTDIKRHNVCCWLIGNCRDESLTQRRVVSCRVVIRQHSEIMLTATYYTHFVAGSTKQLYLNCLANPTICSRLHE